MGGVELSDMQRLCCNATVVGMNQCWLKLFLYLFDVGTVNYLVLCRLPKNNESVNIDNFKLRRVAILVSKRIEDVSC